MLFNSFDFAIFVIIVFVLYWFVFKSDYKKQNMLIVLSSYVFYSWWDWRFLILIIFSTIVDYNLGQLINKDNSILPRKVLLWISISVNLGILGFFKYFNFFIDSFTDLFLSMGYQMNSFSLKIILPIGISFYTFQTMSYTIDVYRRKMKPINDFVAFSAFVSFFPQLVAGPIERAQRLLPQFTRPRVFNETLAIQGVFQILWGLFKKVVIADNCGVLVDTIFDSADASGSLRVLGALFFAFQIYGDFSGYSDIAIGVAKLFGIRLMTNFKLPYFSHNIIEFWRKWHISLSTWFRDYVYIPLGGSRVNTLITKRNILITFIVSGFWHGANWTFIVWGLYHGLLFLLFHLIGRKGKDSDDLQGTTILDLLKMLFTFSLVSFGWIFFRAESLSHAWTFIIGIFNDTLFNIPRMKGDMNTTMIVCIVMIVVMLMIEWYHRLNEFVFSKINEKGLPIQLLVIWAITTLIYYFSGEIQDFIYFQF